MKPVVFVLPGNEPLGEKLTASGSFEAGEFTLRNFPDGETYARILSDVADKHIFVLCSLNNPDPKLLPLVFFADVLREFGAQKITLIAPYLSYMRQDIRFNPGEAITSQTFAHLVAHYFDELLTFDPHLHRYHSLDELYTIPAKVLHAAEPIAHWIKKQVAKPVIIGPDRESKQWAADISSKIDAPYVVLTKVRHGDADVEITLPSIEQYKEHTPVVIDDIISTATTMMQAVKQLVAAGMQAPVCVGVHAIFAGDSFQQLKNSGVAQVVTCNTVTHPSNQIDVSAQLLEQII